jgi:hypothetical protein
MRDVWLTTVITADIRCSLARHCAIVQCEAARIGLARRRGGMISCMRVAALCCGGIS